MPCYVGCMLWCNLLQCFCYLMAFLVILDSQFILIYTKKSTPTTPLNFWLAAQKIMASLSPPPPLPPPPVPPQKRTPFWRLLKSSHPCSVSLYWELTLFFLFFSCKHGKKLHCFVNRHCKPRISYLCCLFFLRPLTHRPLSRIFLVGFFAPQFIRLV